jgi:hypothetical protein
VRIPGLADRSFSTPKYFEPGGRSARMPAAFSFDAPWREEHQAV